MSEETKNLNHTDQKKGEDALKGLSMKERKKALEEKKEKRRTKLYIAIGVVVAILVAALQKEDYDKWYEKVEKTYNDKITTSFMYRFV